MTDPQQPPKPTPPPSQGIYYGPQINQPRPEHGTAGKAAIGTVSVILTIVAICVGLPLVITIIGMFIAAF